MKLFFTSVQITFILILILMSFNCSSQKIELANAQSKNIEFLINQAKNLWDNRLDSNAVKQANYILGLAFDVEKSNSEIANLYTKSLFFEGMFLEENKKKRDSLFFKGAVVAKESIFKNKSFEKLIRESSISDSSFKVLSALSKTSEDLVPALYWWATNKLWYLINKPAIERINHRELLEIIMHRVISLEPDYEFGGAYRFFGVFYSRIPGVELSQSRAYFEKAIASNRNYYGNQVQMSEFYYQKAEDKSSFLEQLSLVKNFDVSLYTDIMAENSYYQKRAEKLLKQQDSLFE